MNIFIDTEFTDLIPLPKLISLGLISDTGKELYLEFEGWESSDCNEFVLETVLPLLKGSNPLSFEESRPLILDWLTTQGEYFQIISDSEYDMYFFREIFRGHCLSATQYSIDLGHPKQPLKVTFETANFFEPPYDQIASHAMESHFLITGRQHHALEDARALRKAWHGVQRAKQSRGLKP